MTERAKPKANSRTKGATFERAVALELELNLGVRFKRNLEQSRAQEHYDLITDDPRWPYACECKRYAAGNGCHSAWKLQALKAAAKAGKIPVVVYKYDRQDLRVAMPIKAIIGAYRDEGDAGLWAETSMEGFCLIAREQMAGAE